MRKLRDKINLLWCSKPRLTIMLTLLLINVGVIFAFTLILSMVSGNPFFDELAYIFTYTMCSDGIYDFVNSQEDVACFVIKIILTVLQMIIFSGALIGFSTDLIQNVIDKRVNNVGKINLNNHYVFLNWSSIGPNLIYNLYFLEGEKKIIILCEEERTKVLESIQNIFAEKKLKMKNMRIFIKNGSPSSIKHLQDISIEKAKSIGVLLDENIECNPSDNMSTRELNVLKILMSVVNNGGNSNIVVEVEDDNSSQKIEKLLEKIDRKLSKRIVVFSHQGLIGHILGKALIDKHYIELYEELLSYDGCEFYEINPMSVENALSLYNDCIPIINYDDDDEIDKYGNFHADHLYILSDTRDTLGERKTPKKVESSKVEEIRKRLLIGIKTPTEDKINIDERNVVIFTHGDEASFVIEEIENTEGLDVRYQVHTYSERNPNDKIQSEELEKAYKVVLLSSGNKAISIQDEGVFWATIDIKTKLNEGVEIIAEIVNSSNVIPITNLGVNTVVESTKLVSLFMVQLLTHPESRKFYKDLITSNKKGGTDAIDLEILTADTIFLFDNETSCYEFNDKAEFVQTFYEATESQFMCIAIKLYDEINKTYQNNIYLCDKMDDPYKIKLHAKDKLILVSLKGSKSIIESKVLEEEKEVAEEDKGVVNI